MSLRRPNRLSCRRARRPTVWRSRWFFRPIGELLEPRLPLTSSLDAISASPRADWFQSVARPASSGELSRHGASAVAERWIISLHASALLLAANPSEATALLNPATVLTPQQPWGFVSVLRGLGLPGQLLVEVQSSGSLDVGQYLDDNAFVALASRDESVAGQTDLPDDPEIANQSHLNSIAAPEAWDITTGSAEIIVGVVDSGIDLTHPDLYLNVWLNPGEIPGAIAEHFDEIDVNNDGKITLRDLDDVNQPLRTRNGQQGLITDLNANNYIDAEDILADPGWADRSDTDGNGFVDDLFGWDFVNNDNDPLDDHGHGTHVAGIIAALANNDEGVVGVTWETSLLPVKFLSDANTGDTANAIAATNYLTALRSRVAPAIDSLAGPVNVRVVNNSWGVSGGTGDVNLRSSIAAAGDAGILLVAGAGNGDILGRGIDLDSTPFFPASYDLDNIVSVAATDSTDPQSETLAPFSNFGLTSVDIAAPGIGILSTERGGNYGTRNGTSMAAPQVSGVAALVLATHPDASVSEVKNAILQGATRLDSLATFVATGALLNAAGALAAETFAPQASLQTAPDITTGSTQPQNLAIRFSDTDLIDATSFDNNDIIITRIGFASTVLTTTRTSAPPAANALTHDVTYRLAPPGGSWDAIDSGIYEVKLRGGQVRDVSGIESQARTLGTFRVQINDPNVFIVNSTADSVFDRMENGQPVDTHGKTSLRAAIIRANAHIDHQTILVPEGTYLLARSGAGEDAGMVGDLDITGDLELISSVPSANTSSPPATIIDARQLDRILDISAAATVTLSGVTLSSGFADTGGGIRNFGTLTLSDLYVTGNISRSAGGGVENRGTITIRRSWVADNQTTDTGDAGGGGLFNDGAATIEASTFSGNRSAAGIVGNAGGGAIQNTGPGTLTITNSTISDNTATKGNGGGIFSAGVVTSVNSTIAVNAAPSGVGGGIFNEPGQQAPVAFEAKFGAAGPAFDEFSNVQSIAFDAFGNTYVLDTDHHRVQVFDPTGILKLSFGRFGSQPGQFTEPEEIVIDSHGRIYIKDRARIHVFNADGTYNFSFITGQVLALAIGPGDRIYSVEPIEINVYSRDGVLERTIPIPIEVFLSDIAVDGDERIIGVDPNSFHQRGYIFDKSGAQIATFGQSGFGQNPGDFSFPSDVAIGAGGEIYVTEFNNQNVQVFSASGEFLRKFTVPRPSAISIDITGRLHVFDALDDELRIYTTQGSLVSKLGRADDAQWPRGIAVDALGNVIVADTQNHQLLVYGPNRSIFLTIGGQGTAGGKFNAPTAGAINPQGRGYVADTGNHRVQIFDGQNFFGSFGTFGSAGGEFSSPSGVAISSSGNVFIADTMNHRIQVFTSGGIFVKAFGGLGTANGKFDQPRGLAFDPQGRLYVADSLNHRVQVFDSNGVFISSFGSLGSGLGQLNSPGGVAIDASGNVIAVADTGNDRISVFAPPVGTSGAAPLYSFGTRGSSNGQFIRPNSIAFDGEFTLGGAGRLYVAETGNDRIQVFRPAPPAQRTVHLKNTIVAQNIASADADLRGTFNSQGHNLIAQIQFGASGIANNIKGDIVGTSAAPIPGGLAALQASRGFVPVQAPLPASVVIDRGDLASFPSVDQSGTSRPKDGDGDGLGRPDIGAVERFDTRIQGQLFADRNGDGILDNDEPGLANWTVFIDENDNGEFDPGEPSTSSQADDPATPLQVETGRYAFVVPPGTYRVAVIPPAGYESSTSTSLSTNAPIRLRKVVETGMPLPELDGEEIGFVSPPALDGENVVFDAGASSGFTQFEFADGGIASRGLWQADRHSALTPVVASCGFGYAPQSFDNDKFLFQAFGCDASPFFQGEIKSPGLYVSDDSGQTTTVMNANTAIPDQSGNFNERISQYGTLSDGLTMFAIVPAGIFNPTERITKFYAGSSPQSLVHLANLDSLALTDVQSATLSGTTVAFVGSTDSFHYAVYVASPTNSPVVIADGNTPIPGGTGNFDFLFTRDTVALDGSRVAFSHLVFDFSKNAYVGKGIYVGTSKSDLRRVVDASTVAPGGPGNFTDFGELSYDGGVLAFAAKGTDGRQGIYLEINGQLRKLADTNDTFEGKRPDSAAFFGPFALSKDGVSGNRVAFSVELEGGTRAIYVATVGIAAIQDVSVSVGQELNNIDFAMRPLDGSIAGVVYDDENADAVRSSSEAGLSAWTVFLDQNNNGKLDLDEPQQVTTAQGGYDFDELAGNQTYRVGLVVQTGFAPTSPLESPGFRTILVGPGQDVTSGSLGVKAVPAATGISTNGVANGQVFLDANANGRREASEPGLPFVTVYIDANSNGKLDVGDPPPTQTEEDGRYEFTGLANNAGYAIRVVPQGNGQQTSPRENQFFDATLAEGITPQDIVMVDLNGDGATDVAYVNGKTNEAQVLLNTKSADQPRGAGRFTALPPITRLNSPIDLDHGNFDGNGGEDLIIANAFQDKLTLLVANVQAPAGFDSRSLVAGFFQIAVEAAPLFGTKVNGKLVDDIAVLLRQVGSNPKGRVVLLRNNGNAQFTTAATFDVGTHPGSLAASDLDNDGDQDLVVANTDDKTLQLLRNNNGTFVKAATIPLAEKPYFVTAANILGNDPLPELLTANLDNNTLSLLPNASTTAALSFGSVKQLGTNTGPQFISAVDMDADSDLDLVVADGSPKNVTLHRNRGTGEFAAPESVGIAVFGNSAARSVAAADLNSDGLPDLAIARGNSNKTLSGEFAGNLSLFTNQLSAGANRAAIPTGNETVTALDFGVTNFSPAQNPVNPLDVDSNGARVANDALTVINFLNAFGSGPAPIPLPTDNPKIYYDVNGDLFVAASDALDVINFLNAFGADGEGESQTDLDGDALLSAADMSHASPNASDHDELFALLALDLTQPGINRRFHRR